MTDSDTIRWEGFFQGHVDRLTVLACLLARRFKKKKTVLASAVKSQGVASFVEFCDTYCPPKEIL